MDQTATKWFLLPNEVIVSERPTDRGTFWVTIEDQKTKEVHELHVTADGEIIW